MSGLHLATIIEPEPPEAETAPELAPHVIFSERGGFETFPTEAAATKAARSAAEASIGAVVTVFRAVREVRASLQIDEKVLP